MKNMFKISLLSIFVVTSLSSCFNNNIKSNSDIEGLWISTEETSRKFLSGTQKTVLQIIREQHGELTARGAFLWNGDYSSEWNLVKINYDSLTHLITIIDDEGDTYCGVVDYENLKIIGAVHLENDKKDSLNFIHADKKLETKLFYPRIPDKNGNTVYSYKKPEQIDDGLQTTSIYDENIDTTAITELINKIIKQDYGRIESLLILKDNKLIVEEYFYGYDKTCLHNINSCTKSITSLLLGITLDQNKNIKVDQPVFSFYPQYDSLKTEEKERITLKHVLTMSSGLEWNEYPKEMYETNDRIQYVLSRLLEATPGAKFLYNSGCSMLIGGIVKSLEGKDVKDFANKFLFSPLGITEYVWKTYKNGELEYWNGLEMIPRDMAKIGLLVSNDGKWQSKQLVSKEWIQESTRPHIAESDFFNYGYQWWHRSKSNKSWWKESTEESKEHDMILALGYGGQYIFIVKDLNLIISMTSSDYNEGNGMAFKKIPMVIEEIVPLFE